ARGRGPTDARRALEAAGVPVLENDALRLQRDGRPFWLAGLGDQLALRPGAGRTAVQGVDDLQATLAAVSDDAPVILMAHEPDIFPQVRAAARPVALTVAGHTHGGQVRLFGRSPVVPSRHGNRYAYGRVTEPRPDGTPADLVVSGGLGLSVAPIRLGVPPEIVLLELG
ncbi:MAG: metallophosphoesterase, partial [Planctomycetota bacterium]